MEIDCLEVSQDTLWDNAMWGLALINRTGRFIKANPALCSLLEYTESELKGMTFQSITHPSDLYDDVHMSEEVESGKTPYYIMTKRYITKTNNVIWVKLRVDRIKTSGGVFCHFLSQISPEIKFGEIKSEIENPSTSVKKLGSWSYVKANLKWIIPLVCAAAFSIIGGGYKMYHEWENYKAKIDTVIEAQTQISEQ